MRVGGRLCETGEEVTLTVEGGRITASSPGIDSPDLGGSGLWLAPGFIDLQVNGYAGSDFNRTEPVETEQALVETRAILLRAAQAGTALLLPTITTNSREAILVSLGALSRSLNADPRLEAAIPGLHLEGPYLSSEEGPRGAHPAEHARDPSWDEFRAFQEAAGGRIRICTLAPERDGALDFIEMLTEAGVVVSLGHTAADPQRIRDAVRAGARMSTHLGNGCHALLPRHASYLWEQMAHDGLVASIIADGHHLPPALVKVLARAKGPERLVLVSDAVSLGGRPPGMYDDGRHEVLDSGMIRLAGTPFLAGAGHLLDTGVANLLRFTDLSLRQAVDCVTALPARLLGLEERKGRLQVGCDADLTLFRVPEEGPLEVAATVLGGEVVYRRGRESVSWLRRLGDRLAGRRGS